jgi:hypothetical protein
MMKSEREAEEKKRKTYHSPKLEVHGDMRVITKAKGGAKADGGAPPGTRV